MAKKIVFGDGFRISRGEHPSTRTAPTLTSRPQLQHQDFHQLQSLHSSRILRHHRHPLHQQTHGKAQHLAVSARVWRPRQSLPPLAWRFVTCLIARPWPVAIQACRGQATPMPGCGRLRRRSCSVAPLVTVPRFCTLQLIQKVQRVASTSRPRTRRKRQRCSLHCMGSGTPATW